MRDVWKMKGKNGRLLSPYWYFTIIDENNPDPAKRRRHVSTKIPIKAGKNRGREKAAELQALVSFGGRAVVDVTLSEFIPRYLAWAESRKRPSTVRGERSLLARLSARWGSLRLGDITDQQVARYVEERRRDGCVKASINGELAVLSRLCRLALEHACLRVMPFNPRSHRFSRLDDSAERSPLAWADVVTLLESCDERVRLFALVLAYTGLRRGTAAVLTWEQIDLDQGLIKLPAGQMKGKRALVIPISGELADLLRPLAGTGRLFGEHPDTLYKRLKAAMVDAGIYEAGNVCHRLRHSFATDLAHRGVDVRTMQALLGHQRIETTLRYCHTDESRQRQAIERRSLRRGRVVVAMNKGG